MRAVLTRRRGAHGGKMRGRGGTGWWKIGAGCAVQRWRRSLQACYIQPCVLRDSSVGGTACGHIAGAGIRFPLANVRRSWLQMVSGSSVESGPLHPSSSSVGSVPPREHCSRESEPMSDAWNSFHPIQHTHRSKRRGGVGLARWLHAVVAEDLAAF